jgi:hypothetical protein
LTINDREEADIEVYREKVQRYRTSALSTCPTTI